MIYQTSASLIALLIAACGGNAPQGALPPRPGSNANAPPIASAVASAPAGARPGLPLPTFHLTNVTSELLTLFSADGGVTFAAGGSIFSKLGEDGLEQDELFGKGLPRDHWNPITGISGSSPGTLWATVVRGDGRIGSGELYRSGPKGWSRARPALPQTRMYFGIGGWSDGRVLALHGYIMPGPSPVSSFEIVSGPPAPLPVLAKAPDSPRNDPSDECKYFGTLLKPEQLAVLTSGHVFVMGPTCSHETLAVEHWEPRQTQSSVHIFMGLGDQFHAVKLLARSETDVVLFVNLKEHSMLARFDGVAWTSESLALGDRLTDAHQAPDGTLFAIVEPGAALAPSQLWWRPLGQATFTQLSLPLPAGSNTGATAVAASSKDDIWVTAGGALFHSRPARSGPRKIDRSEALQTTGSVQLPKAAGPSCTDVYVLLYGITQHTPANYDFPLTRKALAGRSEFEDVVLAETEDNGKRFFGAFVKDFAQGTRLAQVVREAVAGSIPAVLCVKPKRIREIKIDWKTGNVR